MFDACSDFRPPLRLMTHWLSMLVAIHESRLMLALVDSDVYVFWWAPRERR